MLYSGTRMATVGVKELTVSQNKIRSSEKPTNEVEHCVSQTTRHQQAGYCSRLTHTLEKLRKADQQSSFQNKTYTESGLELSGQFMSTDAHF